MFQATLSGLNARGEVIGTSDLAGDQVHHPYLWDGNRMIDLGTLGGDNGKATGINEAGTVTGNAGLADGTHRGFVWSNGTMHDLRPLPGSQCSNAAAINNQGQVLGNSTDCRGNSLGAVIWTKGVPVDLNTLVAPSPLRITDVGAINDRGGILASGFAPNGAEVQVLLMPAGG